MATPTQSSEVWDNYQWFNYAELGCLDEFELKAGAYELPIAADPPTDLDALKTWSPVVVVQAHAPYRIKRVNFKAKKNGSPPQIPSPASSGALVFLGGTLVFPTPQPDMTTSTFNWQAMGRYEFIENCRSDNSDGFVLTGRPFTLQVQADNQNLPFAGNVDYGAVAQAGPDAQMGYLVGQAAQSDGLTDPYFAYTIPTFWPSMFLSADVLNGYAPIPQKITLPSTEEAYPPDDFDGELIGGPLI